jgi:hypothetical protein
MILTGRHNIHLTSRYRVAQGHTDYSVDDVARFWSKVGEPTKTGCWLWLASKMDRYGHGQFTFRREGTQYHRYAHRVSWELNNGPIPDGLKVCHNCPGGDNALCVNPAHLFLGTQADNLADARRKGMLNERLPRQGKTFSPEQRQAIFDLPPRRGIVTELAKQYGVSKACISNIRKGRFARQPLQLVRVPFRQLDVRGEVG